MTTPDEQEDSAEEKALRDLKKAEVDLEHAEDEVRAAEKELEEAHKHKDKVTIVVDGVDHRVRRGMWIVRDLKAEVGIDQAKVLAEITTQGLKDLDDNAEIEPHEKEQFMTHARSGGSS